MMPEVTQAIEASGVMFVQSVSVLMPKATQAIEASGSGVWWSTTQQLKQPVNYQLSLLASAFMQKMSSKTALKQDKFTGSEGDLAKKVEQNKYWTLDLLIKQVEET